MKKDDTPRNFFAEWSRREQEQHAESISVIEMLKDVSGLAGLKALQSKTPPRNHG